MRGDIEGGRYGAGGSRHRRGFLQRYGFLLLLLSAAGFMYLVARTLRSLFGKRQDVMALPTCDARLQYLGLDFGGWDGVYCDEALSMMHRR